MMANVAFLVQSSPQRNEEASQLPIQMASSPTNFFKELSRITFCNVYAASLDQSGTKVGQVKG